jgi:hydrogenase nickel incorporation protein HypA/HybF
MLMHEIMVAQSLLSMISAEAAKRSEKPIIAKISCGVLNAVNDDVLRFAFDSTAKGTACEGMKLEIEHKRMQGRCKSCAEVFEIEFSQPNCPKCGSEEFELQPDAPLVLEEIEFSQDLS